MADTNNPFQIVYDALWEMADRNKSLTSMIKLNNKESYDKWIGFKTDVSTADFPELALVVDGGSTNFQWSSSHSQFTRMYSWSLTTGNFTICNYHCILWELYRAMVDWDKVLCSLQWDGSQIVTNAAIAELTEGTLRIEQNRGIRGWSSIFAIDVEFVVPTELMRIPV